MLADLSNIDEVKKWILIELTGDDDPDESWFEIPLKDKEIANIVDITLRDAFDWLYSGGVVEGYYALEVVQGVMEYDIPKNIYSLPYQIRMSTPNTTAISYVDFIKTPVFYAGGNYVYSSGFLDTVTSYYTQQNIVIQNLRYNFSPVGQHRFNWTYHKLTLLNPPQNTGDIKLFKCFYTDILTQNSTGMDFKEVFNHPVIRDLLSARCRKKIGWNLKYVPNNLLSNYTIDGDKIYTEAKEDEKTSLESLKKQANYTIFDMG